MSQRRTFSRSYKLAAVKKVVEQGLSYSEVARDLGIRDNMLHHWRKKSEADGTLAAKTEQSHSADAELKRLREEQARQRHAVNCARQLRINRGEKSPNSKASCSSPLW